MATVKVVALRAEYLIHSLSIFRVPLEAKPFVLATRIEL